MLKSSEIKRLSALLKKIDKPHEGLPQSVFEALCGVVPFVACELILINNKKQIFLTWRNDKWWRGWHFPGGLLRFRETFEERLDHVAWEELGVNLNDYKFLFAKDCSQGTRGHVVSLVFMCRTLMKPKNGKFFSRMPDNLIEVHKDFWTKIKKNLK